MKSTLPRVVFKPKNARLCVHRWRRRRECGKPVNYSRWTVLDTGCSWLVSYPSRKFEHLPRDLVTSAAMPQLWTQRNRKGVVFGDYERRLGRADLNRWLHSVKDSFLEPEFPAS